MTKHAYTIEDLLEILAGLKQASKINVLPSDSTIISSIARQVFKGTALTDRQYSLMIEKLQSYKDQFTALDYDFDQAIKNLRHPIRSIDRSKYIKIVDHPDEDIVYQSDIFNGKFIKIRFPFKKSDIVLINEISNSKTYLHQKGSHSHFFLMNERNVINILDRFINKEFQIDKELIEIYHKAKDIENKPEQYLTGIVDMKLHNINDKLKPYIDSEVGPLNDDSYFKFIDRSLRYGFNIVETRNAVSLIDKIVFRKEKHFLCKPSEYSLSSLLDTIWELDRFPIVVVLDKNNCENQLHEMVSYFRDIMPSEQQSVLFRVENSDSGFNQLIKDRKLNNWVDSDTKIVYISNDKLPKVLLNADWSPTTCISYNSRVDRNLEHYISPRCDLIVYREEDISPLRRYSQYYGNM